MKIMNSFAADDAALCRAHSAIVASPKRPAAPMVERRRAPVHAMCLAMSEVYQWVAPVVDDFSKPCFRQFLSRPVREVARADLLHVVCVQSANPKMVGCVSNALMSQESARGHADGMSALVGQYWEQCDADGWIPHVPTADSVCPVPGDVEFDIILCDGQRGPGGRGDCNMIKWDTGTSVVGWRPAAVAERIGVSRASL